MKKFIVFVCLGIVSLAIAGCGSNTNMKNQNESMFFYGTWDAGFFDGYGPSTVTFDEDTVTTKQVIDGREIEMPRTYNIVSQRSDGSIKIIFTGHPNAQTSILSRKDDNTLVWEIFGETKEMKRVPAS